MEHHLLDANSFEPFVEPEVAADFVKLSTRRLKEKEGMALSFIRTRRVDATEFQVELGRFIQGTSGMAKRYNECT
jgi:hypothetical protein